MSPETLLIGVDDTDVVGSEIGTGKMVRMLAPLLPAGARMVGVIRHQLLQAPEIAYTTNNSPACALVEIEDPALKPRIAALACEHVARLSADGSDPGVCVATASEINSDIVAFGIDCCRRVLTQKDARDTAGNLFLEGLGGTNDGIIGALGCVGLAVQGWSGIFIEVMALTDVPRRTTVATVEAAGVRLVSAERDAQIPLPDDPVSLEHDFRPLVLAGGPALLVSKSAEGVWEPPQRKKRRDMAH